MVRFGGNELSKAKRYRSEDREDYCGGYGEIVNGDWLTNAGGAQNETMCPRRVSVLEK